jgi:hypothetical protein
MVRKNYTVPLLYTLTPLLLLLIGCSSGHPTTQPARKIYAFWPPPPDEPHIQFLTRFDSNKDILPKRSTFEDLVYGSEPDQVLPIGKPYGLRMYNGCIYVCDIKGTGIIVLDLRKHQTRIMGASGAGKVNKAVDLAIAPDGMKYVVDNTQSSIIVFNAEERYVTQFPFTESNIVGAAVFENHLYVTDMKNCQVKVLDRFTGKLQQTIGSKGGNDGQFIGPLAVTVDKQGNIYVCDTIRARIQKFDSDGKFLLGFGTAGDRPGNFIRPKHMGIGSDGSLHVVDASFNNVQVFDEEGRVVGYYGANGTHPGAMNLPAGLAVYEGDLDLFQPYVHPAFEIERVILITNQFGSNKVAVYAMGHLKPGKTMADINSSRAIMDSGTRATTQPAKR